MVVKEFKLAVAMFHLVLCKNPWKWGVHSNECTSLEVERNIVIETIRKTEIETELWLGLQDEAYLKKEAD